MQYAVGIEADPDFRRDLELLATSIGCEPLALPAGVRPLYHASAYYVGPFLIALLKEGVELWKSFAAQRGGRAAFHDAAAAGDGRGRP